MKPALIVESLELLELGLLALESVNLSLDEVEQLVDLRQLPI